MEDFISDGAWVTDEEKAEKTMDGIQGAAKAGGLFVAAAWIGMSAAEGFGILVAAGFAGFGLAGVAVHLYRLMRPAAYL